MKTKQGRKKGQARGVQLRIVERKDFKSKRATRATYADFERFRRELITADSESALKIIAAGRTLRRQWAKAGAKIRVTFGCGKKALDSFIRIVSNGKEVYAQTI